MNWEKFCWKFTDWRKVKSIVVEFKLITDSGYHIMSREKEFCLKNKLVYVYNDFSEIYEKKKDLREKNRDLFNKMAKDILAEHQKRKMQDIMVGKCYSGKFIVKCVWEIDLKLEKMTLEEYREASKKIRAEEREKKEKKKNDKQ